MSIETNPPKEPQVQDQINRQGELVDKLQALNDLFSKRLARVTRDENKPEPTDKVAPQPALVPLASDLRQYNNSIEYVIKSLGGLIDRLEL